MVLVSPHSLQLCWTFVMLPSKDSTNELKCFWLCFVDDIWLMISHIWSAKQTSLRWKNVNITAAECTICFQSLIKPRLMKSLNECLAFMR